MDFIDVKELEHYIRCNLKGNHYYNMSDSKIYHVEEICTELSINGQEFADNCFYFKYIPIPHLDITDIFDGFISSLNNKKNHR